MVTHENGERMKEPAHLMPSIVLAQPSVDLKLDDLVEACHAIAAQKGFWDQPRNKGEMIALMHSELSEMLEAIRHKEGILMSERLPGYAAEEEEAADLFIWLADYCAGHFINLSRVVQAKLAYNIYRPQMHGKKF